MKTLLISFFTALLLFSFSFSAQAQVDKKAKTGTLKVKKKQSETNIIYRDSLFNKNKVGTQGLGRIRGNQAGSTTDQQTTSSSTNGTNVTLPGVGKQQQNVQKGRQGARTGQQKVNRQKSGQKVNASKVGRKQRKKNN